MATGYYMAREYREPTDWELKRDIEELDKVLEDMVKSGDITEVKDSSTQEKVIKINLNKSSTCTDIVPISTGSGISVVDPVESKPSANHVGSAGITREEKSISEIDKMRLKITKLGKVGLINQGNTCYLNSITQCLMAIPEFFAELDDLPLHSDFVKRVIYRNLVNLKGDSIIDYDKGDVIEHTNDKFEEINNKLKELERKDEMGTELTETEQSFYERYERCTVSQKEKLQALIKNCSILKKEIIKRKLVSVKKMKHSDPLPYIDKKTAHNAVMKSITNSLRRTYRKIWTRNGRFRPKSLFKTLGKYYGSFDNFDQQDSQEALQLILQKVHDETKIKDGCDITKKYTDPDLKKFVNSVHNVFDILEDKDASKEQKSDAMDKLTKARRTKKELTHMAESIATVERFYKKEYSPISKYTQSFIQSKLCCSVCETESIQTEHNIMLSIPYASEKKGFHYEDTSLNKCLDEHFKIEELDEVECSYCKCKTKQTKKMSLWTPPQILIVHLKRFFYKEVYGRMVNEKKTGHIDFPVDELDMSNYFAENYPTEIPNCKYELFAMSNHLGANPYSGHYLAFTKHPVPDEDGKCKWYFFDDSDEPVYLGDQSEKKLVDIFNSKYTPYVLFYRLKPNEEDEDEDDDEEYVDL